MRRMIIAAVGLSIPAAGHAQFVNVDDPDTATRQVIGLGTTWVENGEVGETLATAETISAPVTNIIGRVQFAGDIDLYKIVLPEATDIRIDAIAVTGSGIEIATGGTLDLNIHVFDALGRAIGASNDGGNAAMSAYAGLNVALPTSTFFVAIGADDISALDIDGNEIQDHDGVINGDNPLSDFDTDAFELGSYQIVFTPIPAPASAALLGLAGTLTTTRRR